MQDETSPAPTQDPLDTLVLPDTVAECHVLIRALFSELRELRQQVTALQESVKLNSRNSSKPPSSDGPASGKRPARPASTRKRGAQIGHKGSFRGLVDEDQLTSQQDCLPASVYGCGGAVVRGNPRRHQVFDIPPVCAEVHEYRIFNGVCAACGVQHQAALPTGVPSGQIGPRALALVGVLATHFHLTQRKTRDLLAQLMGVDFSVGAISEAHGKVAEALKAPVAEAAASLCQAAVLHMDETRFPREGSHSWAWAAVQPKLVVFSIMSSRARYVLNNLIGEQPEGVVVSDRYVAYDHLDVNKRQVCWSHLVRDFTRISERAGQAGPGMSTGAAFAGAGFAAVSLAPPGQDECRAVRAHPAAAAPSGGAWQRPAKLQPHAQHLR